MNSASKVVIGIILLGIFTMLCVVLLFERVPPATIGVKTAQWGGGIVEEDYKAGFQLGITGYHRWDFLDLRTHFLTFSRDTARASTSDRPNLEIRTKDNNLAKVDVTVTYRIKAGEGHLIVSEGFHHQYRDRVTSTVESVLREELAQLRSEDFTSTDTRMARATATLPVLAEAMKPFHVEPVDLLIRAVRFPEQYEVKLQQKQLTNQKGLLASARERVEKQEQVTGVISKLTEAQEKEKRADWDKKLQDVRSDNEIQIAMILGEAEVYDRTTRSAAEADFVTFLAEGKLSLDRAQALRDELRNKALDTVGGRILLATQAAENLQIGEVTLNSNDPSVPTVLDLGEMVRLLIGER